MLSILLVEDNAFMQKIQSALLEGFGHQVAVAGSGQQAINRLKATHAFDLVLMDVQMPEMDGLQTTRALREMGYKVPILALTGNHEAEDISACLQAGMSGFLAKPINRQLFEQEVARLFG